MSFMKQNGRLLCLSLFAVGCYQSVPISRDGDSGNVTVDERFYTVGDVPSPVVYAGADLLVVIDNSISMAEEQQTLATGFFALINALTRPVSKAAWPYPPLENMRLAVVTSDMGLQYGENRQTSTKAGVIDSCFDLRGDDGEFMEIRVNAVRIEDGVISCTEGGGQCPMGFTCDQNRCVALSGNMVSCPAMAGGTISDNPADLNGTFALQAACLIQQGTNGCGMEQQLEAGVRGLERHPEFLKPDHVLAMLVVSDEEDCSIEDAALFTTPEWQSGIGDHLNIACNIDDNGQYLISPAEYRQRLADLKGDMYGLVFGAVVGVPPEDRCQGNGFEIRECLDHPKMKQTVGVYETGEGREYTHFDPACTRSENGVEVTAARPGRRYVEVARHFGSFGVVFSICNRDWHPALESLADAIALNFKHHSCFHTFLPVENRDDVCEHCVGVEKECDLFVEIPGQPVDADGSHCPRTLYADLTPAEKNEYMDAVHIKRVEGYRHTTSTLYCPLPNLVTPRECDAADTYVETRYDNRTGWYYCRNHHGCEHEVTLTDKGFEATRAYRRLIKCGFSD